MALTRQAMLRTPPLIHYALAVVRAAALKMGFAAIGGKHVEPDDATSEERECRCAARGAFRRGALPLAPRG
jgi:hypothetical protein